jgi:hypothetical protein
MLNRGRQYCVANALPGKFKSHVAGEQRSEDEKVKPELLTIFTWQRY